MSFKSMLKKFFYSSGSPILNSEMSKQDILKPSEEKITTTMIGGGDYEAVG